MAPKIVSFPFARPTFGPRPSHAQRRAPAARAAACPETATVLETLHEHIDQLDSPDVEVARLRTALAFYRSAPRPGGFETPTDVAGAFQNANWRSKCRPLMKAVAERMPQDSRSYHLLALGYYAMGLDQRVPTPGDAARFFFTANHPRFARDTVSPLDAFKTELASLPVEQFGKATCRWLRRVGLAIELYEESEALVAELSPVTYDDLNDVAMYAQDLQDVLTCRTRPGEAALGNPRTFGKALDTLLQAVQERLDDIDLQW